jgi:2-methylcitrate dehydratase
MVAVPLIFGRLTATDYDDQVAQDPRIDALRSLMVVRENPGFTKDYFDPDKRFIGNAVQVFFKDGTSTARVQADYPIGHRLRREEGIPVLMRKFEEALAKRYSKRRLAQVLDLIQDVERFEATPLNEFMDLLAIP